MGSFTAAIVAGGRGTRFKPYTDLIPKPAIPVGPRGLPLILYIAGWLAAGGAGRIAVLAGQGWEYVYSILRDGVGGVPVVYSLDGEGYSNTGGAVSKAVLSGAVEGDVVLWYGDIIAEVDPARLVGELESRGLDLLVVVATRYQVPVGVAVMEDGRLVEIREKPWLELKPTIGIAAARADALARFACRQCDFYGEMVPAMIRGGARVGVYLHEGPWYDVGSLERYVKLDPRLFPRFWRPAEELLDAAPTRGLGGSQAGPSSVE